MATLHDDVPFPHDDLLEALARDLTTHPTASGTPAASRLADAVNERLRLARELHDGLLQALTGISLQLDAVNHLIAQSPEAASRLLGELQEMVVEYQHELRKWIENARTPVGDVASIRSDATATLEKICRRASRFGPHVEFHPIGCERMPASILGDVCRLVEEGLSNVRQHARARVARVDVVVAKHEIRVAIEDDGSGFSFRGRYDLAALETRHLGPVSIKERIASLGGNLVLTSSLSGTRLDIALPVRKLPKRASNAA